MASSLIVEPIALGVLKIQAEHVLRQVESIRTAIEKQVPRPRSNWDGHLSVACSYLQSIEQLMRTTHSCLVCEINDREKLAKHLTEPAAIAADPRS